MTGQLAPDVLAALSLHTQRLGPLRIISHFLDQLGLNAMLDEFVPTIDPRVRLPCPRGLGVLLRSILVEREPAYRQQETVSTYAPGSSVSTPISPGTSAMTPSALPSIAYTTPTARRSSQPW